MEILDPLKLIAELEPYVTSSNDVPVERATVPAALLRKVIECLDICETLGRHAADCQAMPDAWKRRCPTCKAPAGKSCRVKGTQRYATTHAARLKLVRRLLVRADG